MTADFYDGFERELLPLVRIPDGRKRKESEGACRLPISFFFLQLHGLRCRHVLAYLHRGERKIMMEKNRGEVVLYSSLY
jgi:hypothetical protein